MDNCKGGSNESIKENVMTPFQIRRKTFFCFLFLLVFWLLGFAWFIGQIPNKQFNFSENSADAIVVLTGGSGRLEYGLLLLSQNNSQKIFISGVGVDVKISDILKFVPKNIDINSVKKLSAKISLGRSAENTIGNAQETSAWINEHKYKSILLVTSDYHTPRAVLEFSEYLPNLTIIPAPVLVDDKTVNEKGLTISEYNKYLASKLRHIFVFITEAK